MKLYKLLAGAGALLCAGQVQAVTYYHFTVDFSVLRTSNAPVTGAESKVVTISHADINLSSDPSNPLTYYGPGNELYQFNLDDTDVSLLYDLPALDASTSANPISTPYISIFPHTVAREFATILSYSNSAYASATPTGALGRTTSSSGYIPAAPEPAAWMTMIAGLGLIGAAMRYRRTNTRLRFA